MKNNTEILNERMAEFNQRVGPRVGDFLKLPRIHPKLGEFTRLTHDWGDTIQTGGLGGSYYLGSGLSYSGGLDPGLSFSDIGGQVGERLGEVWFFDEGISGAGRGVYFQVSMRVFAVREGANLSGVYELQCPWRLSVNTQEHYDHGCGYWYQITKKSTNQTAFKTEPELQRWLADNQLKTTLPMTAPGEYSTQLLAYA